MSQIPARTPALGTALLLILVMGADTAGAQEPDPPSQSAPLHIDAAIPAPWTIVHHLLGDARQLGTPTGLLILGVGGTLAAAVHSRDAATVHTLSANHGVEEILDAGSVSGNGYAQLGGAAALYGVGALLRKPAAAQIGAELLEAQLLSGALTQAVKASVGRTRPDGGANSFPSGHASASFATAQVIADRFGWRYGVLGYFGATYVGASRISDRQHFASDVIFGAAIGIASAHAVETATHHRVTVTPAPLPRGMGLFGSVQFD